MSRDYELQAKKFSELETEEKEQLRSLTLPDGNLHKWLNDERGHSRRYASLAKQGDTIVGWAAVEIGEKEPKRFIRTGAVGAFTKPEHPMMSAWIIKHVQNM